jgi:hypothetical protein
MTTSNTTTTDTADRAAIEIKLLTEFEGVGYYGYYARGHHAPSDFLAAVREDYDGAHGASEADVHQGWRRCVPVGGKGNHGVLMVPASGPGRGVWPITFVEKQ